MRVLPINRCLFFINKNYAQLHGIGADTRSITVNNYKYPSITPTTIEIIANDWLYLKNFLSKLLVARSILKLRCYFTGSLTLIRFPVVPVQIVKDRTKNCADSHNI